MPTMLAYLDTLIGFAVVMLGASLLITILTQMASALFSHRGANLRWGLETMFQNMPNCPLLKANARQVAEDVLTHHLISDSIFSGAKWLTNRMKLATAVSPDELAAILQDLAARAGYLAIVPPAPPSLASRRPPWRPRSSPCWQSRTPPRTARSSC